MVNHDDVMEMNGMIVYGPRCIFGNWCGSRFRFAASNKNITGPDRQRHPDLSERIRDRRK
jgi:hypothetical protein